MEQFHLAIGQTEEVDFIVSDKQTARYLESGKCAILGTPALVAWMEYTAGRIVDRAVPAEWQSVGSYIELQHDAMTPVGEKVKVCAVLTGIDARTLIFKIQAFDESGRVAKAVHKRILSKTVVFERALRQRKRKI